MQVHKKIFMFLWHLWTLLAFYMCKQKSSSIVQHIPTTYVELKSKFISSSMVPRYGTSPPQFQKLGGKNVYTYKYLSTFKNCCFSIMVIFYFISKLKFNSDQPSKKLYNQNSYYVSRYDINSCTITRYIIKQSLIFLRLVWLWFSG